MGKKSSTKPMSKEQAAEAADKLGIDIAWLLTLITKLPQIAVLVKELIDMLRAETEPPTLGTLSGEGDVGCDGDVCDATMASLRSAICAACCAAEAHEAACHAADENGED